MKSLKITNYKTSGLHPDFRNPNFLNIEDKPFDSGAFGEVYLCNRIDGKPLHQKIVVKILLDDGTGSHKRGLNTIRQLQAEGIQFNKLAEKKQAKTLSDLPALRAFPQFSFEGILDNRKVVGYAAYYLDSSNYLLFDKVFNEPDRDKRKQFRNDFYQLPLSRRFKMSLDLVEGFQALHEMSFVYADLNPKNFFVHIGNAELVLIDFDSGAVTSTPGAKAEVFGKQGEWLAPEIQRQLVLRQSNIEVDLYTDLWSVAIAIHFLLFNFHPLFYLKVRGQQEMKTYFARHQWPQMSTHDANFRQEVAAVYQSYPERLKIDLPPALVNIFSRTINEGYQNPDRRLHYAEWIQAFKTTFEAPEIISFSSDRQVIISGMPVQLTWEVKDAYQLFINGQEVTNQTDQEIYPDKTGTFQLLARGYFGTSAEFITVRVLPAPGVEAIRLPYPAILSLEEFSALRIDQKITVRLPETSKVVEWTSPRQIPVLPGIPEPGLWIQELQVNFQSLISKIQLLWKTELKKKSLHNMLP